MLLEFRTFDTENLIRNGTFPVRCVTGERRSDRDVCAVKCHHTVNASVICGYATSGTAYYDIFHYILRGDRRVRFDRNTISSIKLCTSIGCSAAPLRCMAGIRPKQDLLSIGKVLKGLFELPVATWNPRCYSHQQPPRAAHAADFLWGGVKLHTNECFMLNLHQVVICHRALISAVGFSCTYTVTEP